MGKSQLTVEETKQMLLRVARGMQSSKEMLTHADQAIGDGDHGIGIIGEYLARMHFRTMDKPAYVVESTANLRPDDTP